MNSDGFTYIFYNKYASKSSAYNNPAVSQYTLEKIFSLDADVLSNQEAIDEFNSYMQDKDKIKEKFNFDLYKIFHFQITENKNDYPLTGLEKYKKYEGVLNGIGVKTPINYLMDRFLIIGVDNKKLEATYKNIPNKEFLLKACSSHMQYEKYSKCVSQLSNKDTKKNGELELFFKNTIITNTDSTDPIIDTPCFTKLIPFEYQRKTVKWMLDRELNNKTIYYSFNDEIYFGNIVCDVIKKDIFRADDRKFIHFYGGLLAEEVGLGKTFETIMTSLLNPAKNCSYFNDKEKRLKSRATIILGPNHLCNQWIREFDKTVKDNFKLNVIPMFTKTHHDKYSYYDLLDADFIIVSFNFLKNEAYYANWLKLNGKTKTAMTFIKSNDFNLETIVEQMDKLYDEFKTNPKKLSEKKPILNLMFFHRIAFDEFHEVILNYPTIHKILPLFRGTYRWAITGTPFNNKDTICLDSMVKFITNNDSSIEKLFENKIINKYFNTSFYRRNTKQSVRNEYRLEPYDEKTLFLKMSPTERAIYNAYLANPNINRYSTLVRQLCDDPRIAEEIKGELSECKTPEDIEKTLVKHYQRDVELVANKIEFIKYRIKKLERKIVVVNYKRQRKYLRIKGWEVKLELPDKIYDPKFENKELLDDTNINNGGNGGDDDDDESDDEDNVNLNQNKKEKEQITVNSANQELIIKLVGLELNKNPSITLNNLEDNLIKLKDKLEETKKIHDGKKITANFFTNMIEKIKKLKNKKTNDNSDDDTDDDSDDDADNCTICLGEITGDDVGVLKCGHLFCFQCIKEYIVKNPKCPLCTKPVKQTDLTMISFEKEKPTTSKEMKDKQDLIAKVGTKLANLILYIKNLNEKCIIFSQWDDMLKNVGDTLDTYNIRNVFCRGNVWTRDKAIRSFTSNPDIKAIMLSSESAAAGTNLTAASTVILLDPVYKESEDGTMGSYEYRRNVEWQAIGRAYRTGQTKKVTVVRMIIKDSVEEEIYKKNKEADEKHKDNKNLIDKLLEVSDDNINVNDEEMKNLNKVGEEKAKLKELKKPQKKPQQKKIIEAYSDDDDDDDNDDE